MAEYKVYFNESVEKDFSGIPKKDLQSILRRIENLAKDPRPQGHEKLTGQERYRVRQGRYRIVYCIQDKELTVWVVKVGQSLSSWWRLTTAGLARKWPFAAKKTFEKQTMSSSRLHTYFLPYALACTRGRISSK